MFSIGFGKVISERLKPSCLKLGGIRIIAHPTDLWPVFWELANDGVDAPDFAHLFAEPDAAS